MQTSSQKVSLSILVALGMAHLLNDTLQAILTASYPLLKSDLLLSFSQIGLIALVYQIAASVFQPIIGLFFDRWPSTKNIPLATLFTMVGLLTVAFSMQITWILVSVFLVGLGSATLHTEASRITSLAAGGRRGMGQSIFQVGGNIGSALGPLLVGLLVAPFGRQYMACFVVISIVSFVQARIISRWYGNYLREKRAGTEKYRFKKDIANPFSTTKTLLIIGVLMILIFSKYIFMASVTNYYTFYLMEKFGVSISTSQILLFVFVFSTAGGTLVGGPLGDKIGRKWVIWISILGTAPFSLLLPHMGSTWFANAPQTALFLTVLLTFGAGFMLSSAFPAILLYSQELLPRYLGLVSGLFFGFAFGVAGVVSALMGKFADIHGLQAVFDVASYSPLMGLVALLLPNLQKKQNNKLS